MKHLKRLAAGLLLFVLCLSLCACGNTVKPDKDAVKAVIANTVENRIMVLSMEWTVDGVSRGTTAVQVASPGKPLGQQDYTFELTKQDVNNEELRNLTLEIRVSEGDGDAKVVAAAELPGAKFGDLYRFELCYADGSYSLTEKK